MSKKMIRQECHNGKIISGEVIFINNNNEIKIQDNSDDVIVRVLPEIGDIVTIKKIKYIIHQVDQMTGQLGLSIYVGEKDNQLSLSLVK